MLFWVWLISSQWKGSCPLLSAATLTAVTSRAPSSWLCALLTAGRCCKGGNVGELSAVMLFCFVCFERRVEVELFTFLLKSSFNNHTKGSLSIALSGRN